MSISVRYIYSACVVIKTPDITVLCDPWFTEGIFDGSWYQFPKLENPVDIIGDVDAIYISHIHPDHYDPQFLRQYFLKYGKKDILIGEFPVNFLVKKMQMDGFDPMVINEYRFKDTYLNIIPDDTESIHDIDSCLLVRHANSSVANMNDCVYNKTLLDQVKTIVPNPDIALVAYTGASSYPQTFYEIGPILEEKAEERKQVYFSRYKEMVKHLNAKVNIPFAGQYILGGRLFYLNEFIGVADAIEVKEFDPNAVLPADDGYAVIDTDTLKVSKERTVPYPRALIEKRFSEISQENLDYEKFFNIDSNKIPFKKLISNAYKNALLKSEVDFDFYLCFKLSRDWHVINVNKNNPSYEIQRDVSTIEPRNEIFIDYRNMLGLLAGIFHWNNAYVGSLFETRRFPDVYYREVQNFLNFFTLGMETTFSETKQLEKTIY